MAERARHARGAPSHSCATHYLNATAAVGAPAYPFLLPHPSYFAVCSDDMTLRRYGRKEDVNANAVKEAPRIYSLKDITSLEAVRRK